MPIPPPTPPSNTPGEGQGFNQARKYQPEEGPRWYFPEPGPSTAHAAPQARGLRTGGWITIIITVACVVAAVVWLGLRASEISTVTAEQQRALEAVQSPPEGQAHDDGGILVPTFAPWAPGTLIQTTDHYPEPGQRFTAQSCTVAFTFSGADGRSYAVTAGHCGREGNLVWPQNAQSVFDYQQEVGRFIYSGLYTPDEVAPEANRIDVGIIEIYDTERTMPLVGAPIQTGLGADIPPVQRVCKTGGTTGYTCGDFERAELVQVVTGHDPQPAEPERTSVADVAAVCAASGDSGGPVFSEVNGRAAIIGVVSGTEAGRSGEECYEGMENPVMMSYSNIEQVLSVIEQVVPDAQWVRQSW